MNHGEINKFIISRVTCFEISVLFERFFFFLLTQEKMAFGQLKALNSAKVSIKKKTARKELVNRTAILGHVNRLSTNKSMNEK